MVCVVGENDLLKTYDATVSNLSNLAIRKETREYGCAKLEQSPKIVSQILLKESDLFNPQTGPPPAFTPAAPRR